MTAKVGFVGAVRLGYRVLWGPQAGVREGGVFSTDVADQAGHADCS